MKEQAPPTEVQRALLEEELRGNRQQYWLTALRAKSFKKAGFDDLAKSNAETAAKIEAYIEVIEAELKALEA